MLSAAAKGKWCPLLQDDDGLEPAERLFLSLVIWMISGPVFLAVTDYHFIRQAKHRL